MAESVETPAYELNSIGKAVAADLAAEHATAAAAKIVLDAAAKSDPDTNLAEMRETSTDERIVAIRAQVEELLAAADEILRPLLPAAPTPEEQNAASVTYDAAVKSIKETLDSAKGIKALKGFVEYAEALGVGYISKGKASSTTKGNGPARPRVIVTVDGVEYKTMGGAAKEMLISTSALHTMWTSAGGYADPQVTPVTFTVSANKKAYIVTVIRKISDPANGK